MVPFMVDHLLRNFPLKKYALLLLITLKLLYFFNLTPIHPIRIHIKGCFGKDILIIQNVASEDKNCFICEIDA